MISDFSISANYALYSFQAPVLFSDNIKQYFLFDGIGEYQRICVQNHFDLTQDSPRLQSIGTIS